MGFYFYCVLYHGIYLIMQHGSLVFAHGALIRCPFFGDKVKCTPYSFFDAIVRSFDPCRITTTNVADYSNQFRHFVRNNQIV